MIDFSRLTMLVGPRWCQLQANRDDRERLARSRLVKGQKNHSVNRERSRADRARAAAGRARDDQHRAAGDAYREEVRAYWAGERDTHP